MSVRRLIRIWASANLLLAAILSSTVHAGFISFSCETKHLWNFDDAPAKLNLWENIEVIGYDDVIISGETDNDPIFHITKTVENSSDVTWTAYELTLSEPDVSFDYIYEPNTFSSHFLYTDKQLMTLTFSAPNPVPDRETVTLDFDISIGTTGQFDFTLTQNPLPEPATIVLLGFSSLALLRRKKPRRNFLTTIVLVLATTCVAEAVPLGTADIVYTGCGANGQLRVWGGGLRGSLVRGGVYMLNKTSGTDQSAHWPNGPLGGFCIELSEWAPKHSLTYDVVMLQDSPEPTSFLGGHIGADKAEYLSELWGRFFDPNWVGYGPFTIQQKSNAEAFAAAVWEIIYEKLPESPAGWNVKVDGTADRLGFKCSKADTATANGWLHALDGTGPKAYLVALVYNGKQDYITALPPPGTPEPATIALFGLGSLTLLRKKQRV